MISWTIINVSVKKFLSMVTNQTGLAMSPINAGGLKDDIKYLLLFFALLLFNNIQTFAGNVEEARLDSTCTYCSDGTPSSSEKFVYNDEERSKMIMQYTWDNSEQKWIAIKVDLEKYNTNGSLCLKETLFPNRDGWDSFSKEEYDNNSNLILKTDYFGTDSTEYAYDNNNRIILKVHYNCHLPESKEEYIWNAWEQPVLETNYKWDDSNGWIGVSSKARTYDSTGKFTSLYNYNWNDESMEWKGFSSVYFDNYDFVFYSNYSKVNDESGYYIYGHMWDEINNCYEVNPHYRTRHEQNEHRDDILVYSQYYHENLQSDLNNPGEYCSNHWHDAYSRKKYEYDYDVNGNKIKETYFIQKNGDNDWTVRSVQIWKYDELNRLLMYSDGYRIYEYAYDQYGHLILEVKDDYKVVTTYKDNINKLTENEYKRNSESGEWDLKINQEWIYRENGLLDIFKMNDYLHGLYYTTQYFYSTDAIGDANIDVVQRDNTKGIDYTLDGKIAQKNYRGVVIRDGRKILK